MHTVPDPKTIPVGASQPQQLPQQQPQSQTQPQIQLQSHNTQQQQQPPQQQQQHQQHSFAPLLSVLQVQPPSSPSQIPIQNPPQVAQTVAPVSKFVDIMSLYNSPSGISANAGPASSQQFNIPANLQQPSISPPNTDVSSPQNQTLFDDFGAFSTASAPTFQSNYQVSSLPLQQISGAGVLPKVNSSIAAATSTTPTSNSKVAPVDAFSGLDWGAFK
jgi:hypothetical protein